MADTAPITQISGEDRDLLARANCPVAVFPIPTRDSGYSPSTIGNVLQYTCTNLHQLVCASITSPDLQDVLERYRKCLTDHS